MIGVYEKSMPNGFTFGEKLSTAKAAGFDFMEISIDETEEKLSRIYGGFENVVRRETDASDFPVLTMCLSAHRKYPLGSLDEKIGARSLDILRRAVDFAVKCGIRIIQLAGYDEYYNPSSAQTGKMFEHRLDIAVKYASGKGVMLGFETMETPFMNTVEKVITHVKRVNSPYLTVYPDVGNIRNGTDDYLSDIACGAGFIAAAHLKETKENVYRNLFFGEGRVDFKGCINELKKQGVNLFNCEFWYDGKSDPLEYLKRARSFFSGLGL